MAKQQWTKRCSDGSVCRPNLYKPDALKTGDLTPIGKGDPSFIADEHSVCDYCLIAKYMDNALERYDGCGDPWAMNPLYDRDDVVAALRRASGE